MYRLILVLILLLGFSLSATAQSATAHAWGASFKFQNCTYAEIRLTVYNWEPYPWVPYDGQKNIYIEPKQTVTFYCIYNEYQKAKDTPGCTATWRTVLSSGTSKFNKDQCYALTTPKSALSAKYEIKPCRHVKSCHPD